MLLPGTGTNKLLYSIPNSGLSEPIKLITNAGFVNLVYYFSICGLSQDLILCSQPIDMNQHSIKNMKSPVNKFGAVNKAYTDRIKYNSATRS